MLFKKKNYHKTHNADISEARKEQIKALAKKHKNSLYILLVAVVVLIAASFSYRAYNKTKEEKYSAMLQQVLIDTEKGNSDVAKNSLRELYKDHSVPAGVRSLASLKYAATLLNDDKVDEAVNVYIETNKNKKFDPYIRELAGLLALKSMIDANSSIFDEKIVSLADDLEKNSKTLKYFALEQRGIFEWNRGNDDVASDIFQDLAANPEVSGSIRNRSKEMADITSVNLPPKDKSMKKDKAGSKKKKKI